MTRKNSQIHIVLETELLNLIDLEASECGITRSEYIRQKLRENTRITKIEIKLELLERKILKRLENGN